jgi:hypothetical protein
MLRGLDIMSNDKVRPDGYYLAITYEQSKLQVVYVYGDVWNVAVEITGDQRTYNSNMFYWIADEPLDLDALYKNP